VVYDEGLRTLAPRWSPDGQRIAFHTIDDEGLHRSYVAGASGEPAGVAQHCRPYGLRGTTAGFPLPDWAPSARGTVRVAVLSVDFPDAEAAHTTHEEAAFGLEWAEEYLEKNSYNTLDVEFVFRPEWLRAPNSYEHYLSESAVGGLSVGGDIYADAVSLVDDEIDFGGFDSVAVVLPSTHFGGGSAGGSIEADGTSMPRHINNNFPFEEPRELAHWGSVAAHELAHNLGLLDMYPYDFERHTLPELTGDDVWAFVDMGLMGLRAQFRTQSSDERLQIVWRFPDGSTSSGTSASFALEEMLGWSRWQLGWLDPSQVHCDSGDGATVPLTPIADAGDGVALAVVPLSAHEVIVIESRRKIGYDTAREWTAPDTRARTTFPGLVSEGVLVYIVDTFIGSGDLPVKVAGDSGDSEVDDFPVLKFGESVTLHGYTISVMDDDGDTHTVLIQKQ